MRLLLSWLEMIPIILASRDPLLPRQPLQKSLPVLTHNLTGLEYHLTVLPNSRKNLLLDTPSHFFPPRAISDFCVATYSAYFFVDNLVDCIVSISRISPFPILLSTSRKDTISQTRLLLVFRRECQPTPLIPLTPNTTNSSKSLP